jgi:hypothetical protein
MSTYQEANSGEALGVSEKLEIHLNQFQLPYCACTAQPAVLLIATHRLQELPVE